MKDTAAVEHLAQELYQYWKDQEDRVDSILDESGRVRPRPRWDTLEASKKNVWTTIAMKVTNRVE